MNDTDTITVNVARLLDLGRWLTKEERARRLGQPSHWNQNVWIQVDTDDMNELPIEVVGPPSDQQPQRVMWACGTAACAAGHIALQDGGAPAFRYDGMTHPTPPNERSDDPWENERSDDPLDWLESLSGSEMFFGGRLETIEEHGQRALGLDDDQAGRLFHGDNTWSDMVYLISQFTGIRERELLPLLGAEDMPADPDAEPEEEDDYDPCEDGTCDCDDE